MNWKTERNQKSLRLLEIEDSANLRLETKALLKFHSRY